MSNKLKTENNDSKLKASRYYTEPFNCEPEHLSSNVVEDGYTPLGLVLAIYPLLELERIESFKKLVIDTLKKYPLNTITPEMCDIFEELDIEIDLYKDAFYRSELIGFEDWFRVIISVTQVNETKLNHDVQTIIVGYLV